MVARHEVLNIQAWNSDASAAIALTPFMSVDVSARADLSIDTLSIVISDKHPAMPLLRTHRNVPVIVSFAVNGVELSGLVTSLKQTKDGETTVTVSGDSKHAARMLARARSSSAIDGAVAQVEAPVGDLAAQMIGEAAQRTGLPVYILQEHVGDLVQVEIGSEDTIADVLAPVLEASDTFIDMRMLFPGEELPGAGDILRVQGRTEFKWEQDRLASGAWPQAKPHERLKRAAIMPPTAPMPHLSWAGWAEMSDTGSTIAKTRGVCWMPFDIGQHDRGYWQKDDSHGVRVATVEQLAEARKAGWFEHVTRWSAGTFGASNDDALRQAAEAELVVKTDGSKIPSVAEALSYIGSSAAYAWFDGTYWVLADEADYQAEDAARNPSVTQLQTPGVLVHIHAGRDRRNEVLFSATDGGGLEDWQTTTTSPEAAMIHATTQLSQSTLEALQAGSAAIDPVAGILTPGEASEYVGELPDTVTAIDVNSSPFATVAGTDISRHHLGGAVNINAAGAFFYREMTTSTSSNSVNPVAEIGRAYQEAQGSTSIELTPGFTQSSVFGDDVVIDGRVIPGWKPGDRVSFTEGITRISEVVAGFELHAAWDTPLRVTPVLSRADNGVLDTLARRLQQAERDAANALQQNPQRVPKDEVDTVVDENESVNDAKDKADSADKKAEDADKKAQDAQDSADAAGGKAEDALTGVDDLLAALAGAGATAEDMQAQLEELNKQLQDQGEGTEEKLPLIQAYISANTARWALQEKVDEMQDAVAAELQAQQIAIKQEFEQDRASRPEKVIASAAGSSNPAYPVTNLSDGRWKLQLHGVAGATVISDTWELAGDDRINPIARQYAPTTDSYYVTRNSNQTVSCEWVRTPGFVRSVNDTWTGSLVLNNQRQWYVHSASPEIKIGAAGTSNFDATVSVRWKGPWGYYRIQLRAGDEVLAEKEAKGSSTIYQDIPMTMTVSVSNVTLPANTEVRLWMYRWNNGPYSSGYTYNRLVTRASWTERNI